jgi:hypothetical protein
LRGRRKEGKGAYLLPDGVNSIGTGKKRAVSERALYGRDARDIVPDHCGRHCTASSSAGVRNNDPALIGFFGRVKPPFTAFVLLGRRHSRCLL